jgi:hypothetical protein
MYSETHFHSSTQKGDKIPEEYLGFYSDDPYKVLGLSDDASNEEVETAKKRLKVKYHPDRFPTDSKMRSVGEEIFKRVTIAAEKISNGDYFRSTRNNNAETGYTYHRSTEKEDLLFRLALDFTVHFVSNRADLFKSSVDEALLHGITKKEIGDLLKADSVRNAIKYGFINALRTAADTKTPQHLIEYIETWNAVGVKLASFLKLPEAQETLKNRFLSGISFSAQDQPQFYLSYIEEWKMAGIDLTEVLYSTEFKERIVERAATRYISPYNPFEFSKFAKEWKNIGIDILNAVTHPEARSRFVREVSRCIKDDYVGGFNSLVSDWRMVGVNMSSLINLPEIQGVFRLHIKQILDSSLIKVLGKRGAQKFVENWKQTGWRPSQEILELL